MFRLVRWLTHAGEFLLTCPYRGARFLFATFIFTPALLKRWTATHFPLAQRTGGQGLYGVEQTGLILFGEQASALTRPEQYVLAAAVTQPAMLIGGGRTARTESTRRRRDPWAAGWRQRRPTDPDDDKRRPASLTPEAKGVNGRPPADA